MQRAGGGGRGGGGGALLPLHPPHTEGAPEPGRALRQSSLIYALHLVWFVWMCDFVRLDFRLVFLFFFVA